MAQPAEWEGAREAGPAHYVRETAANLILGRALQTLDGACGMVAYQDVEGRWQMDCFVLPGRPDSLERISPIMDALIQWTLHTEKPELVANLQASRWSRHLLGGADPPAGAMAACPLAQGATIWGAVAVYRTEAVVDPMEILGQLAQVATEPLSALGWGRPEGVLPQA